MYQHMILMCSDYTSERRIALHKSYDDIYSLIDFQGIVKEIEDSFRNIQFSFHHIQTEKEDSDSVVEYDKYFDGVYFYTDVEEFEGNLREAIKVTPEDITKYILTKKNFDKLQIQKLVYFVYIEYFKKHDEPLFEDKFVTWKYGPVIERLYHKFSKYKRQKIYLEDEELEKLKLKLKLSRVYGRDDILSCIDTVLDKYGDKSGGQLIDETHKEDSPWSKVYSKYGLNNVISPEIIKEYSRSIL